MTVKNNHFMSTKYNTWQDSADYNNWIINSLDSMFDFKKDDIFVDIGCGTGFFTKALAQKARLFNEPICVEPSISMSSEAEERGQMFVYNEDAERFLSRRKKYDKVLIKETVHLLSERNRNFESIFTNLNKNGKLIIFTRPKETSLPFFSSAKKTFSDSQPDYKIFVKELENNGFTTEISFTSFNVSIKKDKWYQLLRERFMSNLQKFTDSEIDNGIAELEKMIESEILNFEDNVILISATK